MTELKQEETQQELFRQFSEEPKKRERLPSLRKSPRPILINTSLEQVILLVIMLILTGCLVFFLGVIRGKALYRKSGGVLTSRTAPPPPASPAVFSRQLATTRPPPPVKTSPQTNAPVTAAADLSKPYTIQLVTYKKRELAEREVSALRRAGYFAAIIPSGDYYQVCVGQYGAKEEAKKDLKAFGARYKDCFLRRR